jgi:hypothetical protein
MKEATGWKGYKTKEGLLEVLKVIGQVTKGLTRLQEEGQL